MHAILQKRFFEGHKKNMCIRVLIGVFVAPGRTFVEWNRRFRNDTLPCGVHVRTITGKDVHAAEGVNNGKTFAYLQWAAAQTGFQFVFKMDTDTALCPVWFAQALRDMRHSEYIGWPHTFDSCGRYAHCPRAEWTYMSGGFYGLRMDLVRDIVRNPWVLRHRTGIEDLMVGRWVYHVRKNPKLYGIDCLYKPSCYARHWNLIVRHPCM